jgi:protein transport protein SEC24
VEYLGTGKYMERPPQAPVYLFLIDVTATSVKSGFLEQTCMGLKQALQGGEENVMVLGIFK